MTNQPVPPADDPQDLLSATRDLTRRVRLTQRGAWFPLLVFAAVTLAAIPFYRYGHPHRHCGSTRGRGYTCIVQSSLALWYWPVALLVAYVTISWFYLHRAHQRGVGTRVQPYLVVGAVLALLTAAWALWADAHPGFLVEALHPGSQPRAVLYRIASPAGAIGLALLLLAWIERSWPLLALTVAYMIVTVASVQMGWVAHATPWAFLPHLLADGGTLLIGAILLALAQRAPGRPTA